MMIFAVTFFCLTWGIRLLVIEPLARLLFPKLEGTQLKKFSQSVMEVLNYGTFSFIGLVVVPSQTWFGKEFLLDSSRPRVFPSPIPGFTEGGHEIMRSDLQCYYIMYIARYFQGIISVLLETKRKDFVEMMVHHVVTVSVCSVSYVYGWTRVGAVVMVVFDPADVPLHSAKICKYIAENCTRKSGWARLWTFGADRLFEVFALVFFATRLVVFGYICGSAHVEASWFFPKGVPEWTCVGLLHTLLLLQIFWFTLVIKVAMKLLRGQSVEDVRSDDEDDTKGSHGKKKSGETKKLR